MLAIELPERAPDAPEGRILAAVTLEEQSGSATRTLLLDPSPPPEGERVFVGRSYLPPRSTHAARFAIKDESQGQILVRNRRLDVPDLSGFSASSVVPAERFGPAGTDARLVVGSEEVLPRPGGVFRTGELLRLYLQVYGAAVDPRTSMPRVDVSFRFSSDAKDRPRSMRQPFKVTGAAGRSMGLALPIGDWPAGSYRVDVDLHDRVSGARASVAGAFRSSPARMPALMRVFNTLTRAVETLEPIEPGHVRLYTCGPTVYDFAHIGNFRTYVWEDLLRRTLIHAGFRVTQVMNITDIEDKIIAKAMTLGDDDRRRDRARTSTPSSRTSTRSASSAPSTTRARPRTFPR
jgi:hypothetical protein